MKAVIMAGGEGTRLRPLTSNQPKPMVQIVGRPCMEHIVHLLKLHSFEDVVVTTAFMPQAIRSYFGSGEGQGVNMSYSVEEAPAGTAGSVRLAADQLDETFLVISGDALCDIDLSALVRFHKEKGASVTIGLVSVDNPLEFGIVVTDEEGRIERFLEKPSWGQVFSDTINTGIYVLEPEVLRHVPTDRPYDFSKELFPLLLDMGRPLYGHVLDGYWQDIGNLDQYRQANFDALDGRVLLNVPAFRLRGNVWLGEGVELDDLEQVEGPAFIGNYCRIAPGGSIGPYAVLGSSVTVRESASVTRSVIDASTYVGRSATIEGAILGRSCDVRSHVRVHEGAAIGDECTLGDSSEVLPGIRIYPFKEVESGTIVDRNVVWESRAGAPQGSGPHLAGLVNVDLTPEVSLRLGLALGTALKRGARVVASRTSEPACRLVKRSLVSGINSTGVHVDDLRVMPTAVNRYLLKTQGYSVGVHVRPRDADPEAVQIDIFEQPGIQATPDLEKEIVEALLAPGVPPRLVFGHRRPELPVAGVRELRRRSAAHPGRRGHQEASIQGCDRLLLVVRVADPAAHPRRARGRERRGPRVRQRPPDRTDERRGGALEHEAARDGRGRRPRRRHGSDGRTHLARGRARPRGTARAGPAPARVPHHRRQDDRSGGACR